MVELLIHNSNPANLRTDDCVYRALASFLCVPWKDALSGLINWAADRGIVKFTHISTLKPYMESLGYSAIKVQEKGLTVAEFCDKYAQKEMVYILNCPKPSRHWTVVKWPWWHVAPYVIDAGDCRHFIVDRYWERSIKQEEQ